MQERLNANSGISFNYIILIIRLFDARIPPEENRRFRGDHRKPCAPPPLTTGVFFNTLIRDQVHHTAGIMTHSPTFFITARTRATG